MSARLLSLEPKIFGDGIIQPAAVEMIGLTYDQGNGAYLEIMMRSGHVARSYRTDGTDTGTMARLKAYRDTLVDRINEVLTEAHEPVPGPSEPEKIRL